MTAGSVWRVAAVDVGNSWTILSVIPSPATLRIGSAMRALLGVALARRGRLGRGRTLGGGSRSRRPRGRPAGGARRPTTGCDVCRGLTVANRRGKNLSDLEIGTAPIPT
jgi:hypothetical protein